jgi:hypothetical protein
MNNEPEDESFDRTASHIAGEYVSCNTKGTRKMNANELADALDDYVDQNDWEIKAQAMLRLQQEEIEYWKQMFEKAMVELDALQNVIRKAQEK